MTRMLVRALIPFLIVACVAEADDGEHLDDIEDTEDVDTDVTTSAATCAASASTYTPYSGASSATGAVATYAWQGFRTSYPAGSEDFRGYTLPSTVECSSSKSRRSHLDVTAGCLNAVAVGAYARGQIQSTSGGAFRALALGYAGSASEPLKWTDQSIQYRFWYARTSGAGVQPGFKAFVRYRTENDLYVASWRVDGYVQIKKKVCGKYTTLAEVKYRAPTTRAWHHIRFDAVGNRLSLYVDGTRVASATDSAITWGTAGIRTDAMTGAYIDDWRVQVP